MIQESPGQGEKEEGLVVPGAEKGEGEPFLPNPTHVPEKLELERELAAVQVAAESREAELLENISDQNQELEMLRSVGGAAKEVSDQRDRLWHGLFRWWKNHSRGCLLSQTGGFCIECHWVKKLLDAEKDTPIAAAEEA